MLLVSLNPLVPFRSTKSGSRASKRLKITPKSQVLGAAAAAARESARAWRASERTQKAIITCNIDKCDSSMI